MNPRLSSLPQKTSALSALIARLAFGLTIVLIPFRFRYVLLERPAALIYNDFTDFLLFGSDIAILILLIFWAFSLLSIRRPIKLGPKFLSGPLLGLPFIGLLTSFSSLDVELSLYHTIRLVALFFFYLYVINEIPSPAFIVGSISIQTIVQSAVAIAQFILQHSLGLKSFGEHDLNPAVNGVSVVSNGFTRVLRSYGLAEHPNILGGCLAFSLILLLAVYLYGKQHVRWGVVIVFLVGLFTLVITFSRSAWLAFLAGSGFLIGLEIVSRRWQNLKALIWLGLASVLLLAPFFWAYRDYIGARLNVENSFDKIPIETQSVGGRRLLNEAAIRIILDHSIEGVGLGSSALAIREFYPDFPGQYVPPHFALLAAALETGILGAICYFWLLAIPWILLMHGKITLTHKPYLTTGYALLFGMTLVGFFDIYPWLVVTGRLWHWLIWGWWSVAYEKDV